MASVKRSVLSVMLAILAMTGVGAALSACNTAAGFGQDMRDAGAAISNSADHLMNGQ